MRTCATGRDRKGPAMPRITVGTVVKLLIVSLIVGFVLTSLSIAPQDVLQFGIDTARKIFDWCVDMFGNAITYILIGAVVVLPIWLIIYLLRFIRGRP